MAGMLASSIRLQRLPQVGGPCGALRDSGRPDPARDPVPNDLPWSGRGGVLAFRTASGDRGHQRPPFGPDDDVPQPGWSVAADQSRPTPTPSTRRDKPVTDGRVRMSSQRRTGAPRVISGRRRTRLHWEAGRRPSMRDPAGSSPMPTWHQYLAELERLPDSSLRVTLYRDGQPIHKRMGPQPTAGSPPGHRPRLLIHRRRHRPHQSQPPLTGDTLAVIGARHRWV